jgi:hypothetical protein
MFTSGGAVFMSNLTAVQQPQCGVQVDGALCVITLPVRVQIQSGQCSTQLQGRASPVKPQTHGFALAKAQRKAASAAGETWHGKKKTAISIVNMPPGYNPRRSI